MKKLTIKDIAKLSEVSITTVSKIINGKDHDISQGTIDRVKGIMDKHHYVPNKLAGSLITKTTNTIGLIIPDITNPFFPELVRGAEDRASEAGYSLYFCNSDDQLDKEERYIKSLKSQMVDGLIFTAASEERERAKAFENINMPVVLVDRMVDMEEVKASILVDNESGSYKGTKHLMALGHKRILHITGPKNSKICKARYQGYKNALQSEQLDDSEALVLNGQFKLDWGYKAMALAFERGLSFTAILCGNDLIAMGVLKFLKEKKIKVPRHCSILGYDDIQMASLLDPPLSTVRQPKYQMGYQAVDTMLRLLSGETVLAEPSLFPEHHLEVLEDGKTIILGTELIIRGTCGQVPSEDVLTTYQHILSKGAR